MNQNEDDIYGLVGDEYYLELGRFVHSFSQAEAVIHHVFPRVTGIELGMAQILKKDMTLGALIRLLMDGLIAEGPLSADDQGVVLGCLERLSLISSFRNKTIHRGARMSKDGRYQASNFATMKSLESLEQSTFDLSDVQAATDDLNRLTLRLFYLLDGPDPHRHPQLEAFVRAPWRYKPVRPERQRDTQTQRGTQT